MKLSIIVPVYNVEKYVERCLNSLKELNIENEIIVVNDGSTDNSLEVVERFKNENPTENIIIISQENKGLSEARNTGIKNARGEYISFIDSDDFVDKEKFEILIKEIIKDQLDIGLGNEKYYYSEKFEKNAVFKRNDNIKNLEIMSGEEWLLLALKTDNYRTEVCDDIYKKDFLLNNNIKFKEGRLHEDEAFMIEVLLKAKKVKYYDIPFYNYFQSNQNSIMFTKTLKNYDDMILNMKDILELVIKYSKKEELKKIMFDRMDDYYNWLYLHEVMQNYELKILKKYIKIYKEYKKKYNIKEKNCIKRKKKILKKYFKEKRNEILRKYKIINPNIKRLKNKNFSIISINCIGGIISHELKQRFNSPTVDLYFGTEDFIKFLKNLKYYLTLELKEIKNNKGYPIGKLGDVIIHFLHYDNFEIAKEKWDIRKERINFNNLFIMMVENKGCTYEMLEEFDKLNYKNKVVFTHKKYEKIKSSFCIEYLKYSEKGNLLDFKNRYERYLDEFDYVSFLNQNNINIKEK